MFSATIESVGKTNLPKNVPDPVLRLVRCLRGGYGASNQRVRYMFSGEIESAGKTNAPKNVPDPVLRRVFYVVFLQLG
jgi:hypothetical protein